MCIFRFCSVLLAIHLAAHTAHANEHFRAFGQSTLISQYKPGFASRYSGPNSLQSQAEHSYSATVTAFFGWRIGSNTELFLNPEAARGLPLSRLSGLGGLTNGELARTSGPAWTVYRARAFVRHTWNIAGNSEAVEAQPNQMSDRLNARRWVLTLGNLSALDIFDDNGYAKDPRTDFLNWSLMSYGAWDYPADARGYSWGGALEYHGGDWLIRAGRFMLPVESNGLRLNRRIFRSWGDAIEIERNHVWAGRGGKLRGLLFQNQAEMAGFDEALRLAQQQGQTAELAGSRSMRRKWGVGISVEQAFSPSIGGFLRASWNDGRSEAFAFTEIDRSVAAGLVIEGRAWQRPNDRIGLAWVQNALSPSHRQYLAAGGLGFFLGDGALTYRMEQIAEAFYRWQLNDQLALSLNGQFIRNPGYNRDRGPVRVLGVRAHVSF